MARLADELTLLTRERKVYRDVVNVAVGDDARKDIDEHLKVSDVRIFLQTKEARNSKYISHGRDEEDLRAYQRHGFFHPGCLMKQPLGLIR